MADYMGIYIKTGAKFKCLGYFLRNSQLGELCAHIVKYGEIRKLGAMESNELELLASRTQRDTERTIERVRGEIAMVPAFNNSLDAKCDLLCDLTNSIDELEEQRRGDVYAADVVSFLSALDEVDVYIGYEFDEEVGD